MKRGKVIVQIEMFENSSHADSNPLLEDVGNDHGEERKDGGWWINRILDMEEAKKQVLFGLPMILTNVFVGKIRFSFLQINKCYYSYE